MLPWHQRRSRRREFEHGRRVLLAAAALVGQHAHLVAGAAHQRRLDLIVRQDVAAERRPARQHRQVAMRRRRARCGRARCGPRTARNRRPTRRCPSCRRACRGACRTGTCARTRCAEGTPTTRLCRMPSFGCACMMRTRRTIVSPDIRLSASSGSMNSKSRAPARAEVAHIAGLEARVVAAPAVDDARRVGVGAPPGRDGLPPRRRRRRGSLVSLSTN